MTDQSEKQHLLGDNGRALLPVRQGNDGKPEPSFLHLVDVNKGYKEGERLRVVFQQVNLAVAEGEIIAILGKSGSGKTTLLNLISGIDRVDQGDIVIHGKRLTGLNDLEWTLFRRKQVGFIFQFFNLIPTLTVWENVTLPMELNGMDEPADREWAEHLLSEVGLADRKSAFPDRLSGGEQQRIAIARAMAHNPSIVLADEPTGNLDEDTGRQVLSLLERLTRAAGKSMILVTHSQEAANIADRVFMLREGQLIEQLQAK